MSSQTAQLDATNSPASAVGGSVQRFVGRHSPATLYLGDSGLLLPTMEAINCIVTDVPYGETRCDWDVRMDCLKMWSAISECITPDCNVVTTATQPIAALLITSNLKHFKHEWIWEKTSSGGFAVAKYAPMRYHESVLVFGYGKPPYNPIKREYSESTKHRFAKNGRNNGDKAAASGARNSVGLVKKISHHINIEGGAMPKSVLRFKSVHNAKRTHPTQKPVELMEYMVLTYSNPGDTVCDPFMGSGTTGIACLRAGRNFIGIERDAAHYKTACDRIAHELDGALL